MGPDLCRIRGSVTTNRQYHRHHPAKMKLLGVGIVLALVFHINYAIPIESRLRTVADFIDSNDVDSSAFDELVEQVTNDYIEDIKDTVQFDFQSDFQEFVQEIQKIVNGLIEKVGPKAISIVKSYKAKIVTHLIFKDFEGLKDTVREIAKKIIVVFDDEMIKLITGDGYDEEEWQEIVKAFEKAKDLWTNDEEFHKNMVEVMKYIEEHLLKRVKDYLIDVVSAITDWAVGLLDKARNVEIGQNAYMKLPDIKKILESIENMGSKLIDSLENVLGDVLKDRPFVVKEVKRYRDALIILGKKVAIDVKQTIWKVLKAFADLINRLG